MSPSSCSVIMRAPDSVSAICCRYRNSKTFSSRLACFISWFLILTHSCFCPLFPGSIAPYSSAASVIPYRSCRLSSIIFASCQNNPRHLSGRKRSTKSSKDDTVRFSLISFMVTSDRPKSPSAVPPSISLNRFVFSGLILPNSNIFCSTAHASILFCFHDYNINEIQIK